MSSAPHVPAAEAQDHAALIVALEARDLAGAELRVAESLASTCAGCTALVHDLAAIRGAMTALPVPPRRRDYRLTAADAARLRPSSWRRLLEWLAAPGSTVRPLATGLATLGVVGLLVTSGLPGLLPGLGGSSAAPVPAPAGAAIDNATPAGSGDQQLEATYDPMAAPTGAPGNDPGLAPTAAPAPAATGAPALVPTAATAGDRAGVTGEAATADPATERTLATGPSDGGAESGKAAGRDSASTVPLPALVSLAFLVLGLALVAGRLVARRRLS